MLLYAEAPPVFAAPPLPTEYYSPPSRTYYRNMTFVIPAANKLRQAVRTITLANKRQRAGIHTVILFENTAVNLPVVQGIPYGKITTYTGKKLCSQPQPMPKCPKSVTDNIPSLIPEIAVDDAQQIYLPPLQQLLQEHARLGGKIVLCPCCDRTLAKGIKFLPKKIAPKKLHRLEKQMRITEGNY